MSDTPSPPTVVLAAMPPQLPPAPVAYAPPPPRPLLNFVVDALLSVAILFALSMLFVVPVVAFQLIEQGGMVDEKDLEAAFTVMTPGVVIAAVLASLVSAVLVWLLRGRRMPGTPPVPMAAVPAQALAVVAGVVLQGACIGLALLLEQGGITMNPTNAVPIAEMAERTPWLAWLIVVLVAPFGEELLYRHVLLRRMVMGGRVLLGVVLSSLLFAWMHEPAPSAGVGAWLGMLATYALMGVVFAAVYVRTGRFSAAVVAHAACNLVAMVALAFQPA